MKQFLLAFLFSLFGLYTVAQTQHALHVESYTLGNGFSVFLNEDPSANEVFGAVMVNAGSKNESPDATGMAHYLEHLLFKGTQTMGTKDYEKEKPYLDSITYLYDQLALSPEPEQKAAIQKSINALAVKASEYGLPNELDKLLRSIGGTGINAFTNTDITFYHNSFPAQEINKWLDLYATRFQNPVFRSFQSELEVVYEEKNRGMDNFTWRIFEKFQSMIFPGHPYGEWTTIGTVEHLKNPQLSKMYAFFYKHYVPENMALILSGNFRAEEVKPLIEDKFGVFEAKGYTPTKLPPPSPIVGVKTEYVKYTPVKVGLIGYQTVPKNHPDRVSLDMCEYLLFNSAETGYMNQLQRKGEIMFCGAFSIPYTEAGCSFLFYVPKILSQSLNDAEGKVMGGYTYLREGKFSDQELQAAKFNLVKDFEQQLENVDERGVLIGMAFNAGLAWDDYIRYPEKVNAVTKEEIIRVAKKYYGDNYVRLISTTGFGKNEKLEKPPYKAVVTEQKGKSSYAEAFEGLPSGTAAPRFIDFKKDVSQVPIAGGHTLFAVPNPVNDLFYLELKFKANKWNNAGMEEAADFINYCGAGAYSLDSLKKTFGAMGCTYAISATENSLVFSVDGRESQLDACLTLLRVLLSEPKAETQSKQRMLSELKTTRKFDKRSPDFMGRALLSYALFGKESEYLTRASKAELKATKEDTWLTTYKNITTSYAADILYTGNASPQELALTIESKLGLSQAGKTDTYVYQEGQTLSQNRIYFVNDKKAVQSQIYFYVPGEKTGLEKYPEIMAFNEYFAGGFSGLMLQEIREYRSLAYATGGGYAFSPEPGKAGRLITYIGCQADKTAEAIEVMLSLVQKMPLKEERMADLKHALLIKAANSYPSFKELAQTVATYQRKGYLADVNQAAYKSFQVFGSDMLLGFYQSHIQPKPIAITIYGDKSRIDLKKLSAFGEVVELKQKDFVRF